MEILTREQIQAKGMEWIAATTDALESHERALRAELQHKKHRQRVLQVEEEMRVMKQDAMSLVAHSAMA